MNLLELQELFLNNPKKMNKGAKDLAFRYDAKIEDIYKAKEKVREFLHLDETASLNNTISELEEMVQNCSKIVEEETDHKTGNKKLILESNKPLSPKEIEQLAGVDNIISFVDRSWLKSHKNNTWTYSILTINKIKDFYSSVILDEKLREIFKDDKLEYYEYETIKDKSEKALFIYIADDHSGSILKDSLYGKEYSGSIYAKRLLKIVEKVKQLGEVFSELYIVRLGDELDGYNGKTTRYDHDLNSASNKEQFDIYTIANKLFYDELFKSGISDKYFIRNLCNSNHSGKGFSYIANKALEFWIEAKFPFVDIKHQENFIDIIEFGKHVIGVTHGKDETYMKTPMPINLDIKTDLWLKEYYENKGISKVDKFISTIKGDMHKFNLNIGKSGRYVNVPSICGGSNWIEHNFGDTDAGCLLEIYEPNKKNVVTLPIWF